MNGETIRIPVASKFAAETTDNGLFCMWVESGDVEFSRVKMDVYITSNYAEGSCEFEVVRAHEETHVAIYERVFDKYLARMEAALSQDRRTPMQGNPFLARSRRSGKAALSTILDDLVNGLFADFNSESQRENAKLDTPERYRAESAKCR
jgi:hypothetical protein